MSTINITRQSNGAVIIGGKEVVNPQDVTIKCRTRGSDISVLIRTANNILFYGMASEIGLINGTAAPTVASDLQDVLANWVFAGSATYATPTKIAQTITNPAPPADVHTGPPVTLTGTASSGLPVVFTSSDNSVFTISGKVLTKVGAGSANIIANQAGNAFYAAAAQVSTPYTLT